jgi:hypothetical protein
MHEQNLEKKCTTSAKANTVGIPRFPFSHATLFHKVKSEISDLSEMGEFVHEEENLSIVVWGEC